MTELQLRLWCLWMCVNQASMWRQEAIDAAVEGADEDMALMVRSVAFAQPTLNAWRNAERMP